MTTIHKQSQSIQGATIGRAIVQLAASDLSGTAALTKTFTFAELAALRNKAGSWVIPAYASIVSAQVVRLTDFSGGTVATMTIDVGDAGAPTELIAAADLFTGAKATLAVTNVELATAQYEATAYAPQIVLTSTVGNLDELTAGRCEIAIFYRAYSAESLA
jgi:hypothetical protein